MLDGDLAKIQEVIDGYQKEQQALAEMIREHVGGEEEFFAQKAERRAQLDELRAKDHDIMKINGAVGWTPTLSCEISDREATAKSEVEVQTDEESEPLGHGGRRGLRHQRERAEWRVRVGRCGACGEPGHHARQCQWRARGGCSRVRAVTELREPPRGSIDLNRCVHTFDEVVMILKRGFSYMVKDMMDQMQCALDLVRAGTRRATGGQVKWHMSDVMRRRRCEALNDWVVKIKKAQVEGGRVFHRVG